MILIKETMKILFRVHLILLQWNSAMKYGNYAVWTIARIKSLD